MNEDKTGLPWFGPGERPKWVCSICGKDAGGIFDLVPDKTDNEAEAFCNDCLLTAMVWGIKKWKEAGAPGREKT